MPTLGVNTTRLGNIVRSVLELAADNGTAGGHILPDDLFGLLVAADLTRAGVVVPSWPTTGRPGSNANPGTPTIGQVGFNTTTGHLEVYAGNALWAAIAFSSEAGGGGTTFNPGNQFVIDPQTKILSLAANNAAVGQVMTWNGTAWAPGTAAASSTANPVVIDGASIPATSGTPYQMGPGERNIKFKRGTAGQSYVILPAAPIIGAHYWFKDMRGDAGTYNALVSGPTVSGVQALIDGAANFALNDNWMAAVLVAYSATEWGRIGSYNPAIVPGDSGGAQDTDRVLTVRGTSNTPLFSTVAQVRAGSGGTTPVAPGQVGSLAAGTPTSTTVPLTWTAPTTGTTPFTYSVQVAAHGSSSYSAAAGTFGATGGTVTGLVANTNYDFQVTVANGTSPNSTTTLTTGVTTAAGSGGSYPTFTTTTPFTFGPSGKFLANGLSGGKGSVTFTLPANGAAGATDQADCLVTFYLLKGTTNPAAYRNFVSLSQGSFTYGWVYGDGLDSVNGNGSGHTNATINDGAQHFFQMLLTTANSSTHSALSIDGGATGSNDLAYLKSGVATTLLFDMTALAAGDIISEVRISATTADLSTASPTRTAKTIAIYHANGDMVPV